MATRPNRAAKPRKSAKSSSLPEWNLADLYAAYRLDAAAITEGVAELLLGIRG